jgi:hypothetical protein
MIQAKKYVNFFIFCIQWVKFYRGDFIIFKPKMQEIIEFQVIFVIWNSIKKLKIQIQLIEEWVAHWANDF